MSLRCLIWPSDKEAFGPRNDWRKAWFERIFSSSPIKQFSDAYSLLRQGVRLFYELVIENPLSWFILLKKWNMLYSAWEMRKRIFQVLGIWPGHTVKVKGLRLKWDDILGADLKVVRKTLTLVKSFVSHLEVTWLPDFSDLISRFLLRCLKTSLENLAIMHCLLMESDLIHLSQCPSISQLKGLDMSGVIVTNFRPVILQILLEKVAATVQELGLDDCEILDSQLEAILPALSLCFQLWSFSLWGNILSMAATEKLLLHTAGLPNLSKEFYPAPRESYSSQGVLLQGRFAQLQAGLKAILKVLGQPRTIWLSSSPFLHCSDDMFYHMEPITYHCNSSAYLMPPSKASLETKMRLQWHCIGAEINGFSHLFTSSGKS